MQTGAKKRPRFQFSLRLLLASIFVFCLLLGAFMWRFRRAQEQARIISDLKAIGCSVAYEFEIEEGKYGELLLVEDPKSSIPDMLLRLLGPDFFHEASAAFAADLHSGHPQSPDEITKFWKAAGGFPKLRMLHCNGYWCDAQEFKRVRGKGSLRSLAFSGYEFSKEHLETIGSMSNLQDLDLYLLDSDIDDQSLHELSGLEHLRSLSISPGPLGIFKDLRITDEGVKILCRCTELESVVLPLKSLSNASARELAKLPRLRRLGMNYSQLSDAGIMHFKDSMDLEELIVNKTGISGPGFLHLRKLPKLRRVCLRGNPVGDEDLEFINVLKQLDTLELPQTYITDQGLKAHGLPQNLSELDLDETKVTDEGLLVLAKYGGLKKVSLRDTKTTPEGIAALKKSLPACEIEN